MLQFWGLRERSSATQNSDPCSILVRAHGPLSSSFLWFIFRILQGNPKRELLRGLWVCLQTRTEKLLKPIGILQPLIRRLETKERHPHKPYKHYKHYKPYKPCKPYKPYKPCKTAKSSIKPGTLEPCILKPLP